MRISSNTIFDQGVTNLQNRQRELLQTQQQISTGRRITTPADDPVAASRVLDVTQSASINEQYMENTRNAKDTLSLTESILNGVTELVQEVKTTLIQAGNPSLSATDRTTLTNELRDKYRDIMGLANSRDGNGQYLFSGYKSGTQPFAETSPGVVAYSGDMGQRLLQLSATQQVAVSTAGTDIFERIRNGNGTVVGAAASANTGSGVIDPPAVTNTGLLTGNNYAINFTSATTYNVVNTTTSATVISGATYNSGSSITFDGIQVQIQGAPAASDSFTVQSSANVSVFQTLDDVITALASSTGNNASRRNALNVAQSNMDNVLDNVLKHRAGIGARLKEVESSQNIGDDLTLQYKQNLSQLQDVDYASAISSLTRQQISLEAAQKSFVSIQRLSLFDFV